MEIALCLTYTPTLCRNAITSKLNSDMLNSMDYYWKQIPMTMRMIPILNVITPYNKVHIQ